MKKDKKHQNQKLLKLDKQTVKKLVDNDLERVVGGGSCLPPPPAVS